MTTKTRYTRAEAFQDGGQVFLCLTSDAGDEAFMTLSPQQASAFASAIDGHADRAMGADGEENLRDAAAHLTATLRKMLNPPSTLPTPQQLELWAAIDAVERLTKGGR